MKDSPALLDIRGLSVDYPAFPEPVHAVRDFSLRIHEGESVALVGETGSGKSTVALAALGLPGTRAQPVSGEICFEGRSLRNMRSGEWRKVRSRKMGLVFQDTRGALNPVLTLRNHLVETLRSHQGISRKDARACASELLGEVGIPEAQEGCYPFELSGGACQRAGLALALCNRPRLLIADEPTSALDPATQAQILALLHELKRRHALALLVISHDLHMVAHTADRIVIMYHGRAVESGLREEIFRTPAHPYTQGLMRSRPGLDHHYASRPLTPVPGTLPIPGESFAGCAFAPRCFCSDPSCAVSLPPAHQLSATHQVACLRKSRGERPWQ